MGFLYFLQNQTVQSFLENSLHFDTNLALSHQYGGLKELYRFSVGVYAKMCVAMRGMQVP